MAARQARLFPRSPPDDQAAYLQLRCSAPPLAATGAFDRPDEPGARHALIRRHRRTVDVRPCGRIAHECSVAPALLEDVRLNETGWLQCARVRDTRVELTHVTDVAESTLFLLQRQ